MMIRIDFLLVILILEFWTPVVVTERNAEDLSASAQEFYKSSHQREPLFHSSPKPITRLLYLGSESNNGDMRIIPLSYFQPTKPSQLNENRMRSRPINIFGHYQHHQEVIPSHTAASDRSTTHFRPSPLDPLPPFDDPPTNGPETFEPIYRVDSARGGGNYDDRFVYEFEDERAPGEDLRGNFLESEEERGNPRHQASPDVYERQFQNPGHFRPDYREPSREGLIYHLYQSYLSNLAKNRFRPSAVPNVEVNPRANRKPEAEIQEVEISRNVVAPTFPTREILNVNQRVQEEIVPHERVPHFVVPIQQEILPSPESLRQNYRRYPFDDTIFKNYPQNSAGNPTATPTAAAEILTTTTPAMKIRVHKGFLRQNQLTTTVSPVPTAQGQRSFPALRREAGSVQNLRNKPEPPRRIKHTSTASPPSIETTAETFAGFEENPREEYVGLSDFSGELSRDPINSFQPAERPEYEFRASPNRPPRRPPQPPSQLSRLPDFYPFAFSDGPRLQNFLETERPLTVKPQRVFSNEQKTTPPPRGKLASKKPKIGKLLYSQKKSAAVAGGVYAGFQVFPEYHSYGIPINAQPTPMYRMKTSVVRSEPRVVGNLPSDTGRRRNSHKSQITLANSNEIVARTASKNFANLKPNLRGGGSKPTMKLKPETNSFRNQRIIEAEETRTPPTVFPIPRSFTTEVLTTLPPPPPEIEGTTKAISGISLRKPAGIRKLIARPRPNTFVKEDSKEEQNLSRQPKSSERPKVIIKKVRTRKPGTTPTTIQRTTDHKTDVSELVGTKPTEFPLKYSSRYRNETQQIPPTSLPTASVVAVSNEEPPTPKRPFHSKPRRLVSKLPSKSQSTELPDSVLLSPKDVLVNRKPARRIPVGSVSERLKALKKVTTPDYDETKDSVVPSPSKREIVSANFKNDNDGMSRLGTKKVKSSTIEVDSKEMSELLEIPKPTQQIFINPSKTVKPSTDYENEDDYDDYGDESEEEKQESSNQDRPVTESSSHWSFPIVSIPFKNKVFKLT